MLFFTSLAVLGVPFVAVAGVMFGNGFNKKADGEGDGAGCAVAFLFGIAWYVLIMLVLPAFFGLGDPMMALAYGAGLIGFMTVIFLFLGFNLKKQGEE